MLCQIVVMFLGQSYQDILKRGYYIEFTKTAKHVLMVMLLSVLYLFATQQAVSYSRLTLFYTAFLYLCFDYVGRVWHKENVLKKNATKKKEKSMVVVVSLAEAKETIEKILSSPIQIFSINGIALIDDNPGVKEIVGMHHPFRLCMRSTKSEAVGLCSIRRTLLRLSGCSLTSIIWQLRLITYEICGSMRS